LRVTATETDSTERLLIEAAQKDPSRFGDLYDDYFDRVYAYIAARVRNRAEAEDLTSEVFQQALAGLQRFEWRGAPFGAWLFRIAANAMIDRSKRAAREQEKAAANPAFEVFAPHFDEEIDRKARLSRLVQSLPVDQERVITMRFAEDKSIREIARELGRSEGAIKQLQFRGLRTLRSRLDGRDD